MKVDSLRANLLAYVGFAVLAIVVGVLQDLHRQIVNASGIDPMLLLDAGIVALLPVLIAILGAMKLPSVGHEPLSAKAERHEDRLRVTDAAAPESGRG